ncbi:MAG: thiamine pyrophosphate-dependent enzyme [Candidatus Gastranaerophilales bacterium]|nr:thiamine pyrophosphate-dependent enzyme [Candidatus Gastranaerophilales bacterium]
MEKYTLNDYKSNKPTWCPGCGNFAVLTALTSVFAEFQLDPDETTIVSGIGCSSRFPFFSKTYGFHSIHGRALPTAMGLKVANPETEVVVVGGDGDGFSIGGNHFIHASRKNPNITYIVMDNEIYALTKGQNSPTSHSITTKVNPYEAIEDRINPVLMALSFDTSFIARGYSGNLPQLKDLIYKGMQHEGFSFIHVLSPCVQYNEKFTYDLLQERIRPLPENHDTKNRLAGMELAFDNKYLYTGLFYDVNKPTFDEKLASVRKGAKEKMDNKELSYKEIMEQFA